ncbi:MAG: rRNA maturation RNase YbeY [Rhodospirillales bacterium]
MIDDPAWHRALPGAPALAYRAARQALASEGAPPGGLVLVFGDDAQVRRLNRDFRGRDRPTNVLSFPQDGSTGCFGEVILARQQICREAATQGKRRLAHLAHLVVHAVLHLFGHDHQATGEADRMEWRERHILADLSIPDPYGPAGRLTRKRKRRKERPKA